MGYRERKARLNDQEKLVVMNSWWKARELLRKEQSIAPLSQ